MITVETLFDMQDKVLEWNNIFGNSVEDKSLVQVYQGLVHEEMMGEGEFLESFRKGDDEGIIDGLCDLVFVSFFYCALKDRPLSRLKDETWIASLVNNTKAFDLQPLESYTNAMEKLVFKAKLDAYSFQSNFVTLLVELSKIYDIEQAFDRIFESNMSKSISVHEEEKVEEYIKEIENVGRYGDIFTEVSGDRIIFKARKDIRDNKEYLSGKIVKGSFYHSVEDLGGLEEFIL